MRVLFRANTHLANMLAIIAALLIAAMVLAIAAEVLLRALRLGAIPGLLEATEYALYFSTFLAAPRLYLQMEHIRVDVLIAKLAPGPARSCEIAVSALVIAISGIFCVYGARVLWQNFSARTMIYKDLVLPQWWIDWALPLAFLSVAILALERLLRALSGPAAAPGGR